MVKPIGEFDWKDERSVRLWMGELIKAAEMVKGIAATMHGAMPPPEPEEEPHGKGLRMCVHCGKTDAEVRLPAPFGPIAGPAVSICEDCTRLACAALGIALRADAGPR
jgi:hypothetical protein